MKPYLITDPNFYGSDSETFVSALDRILPASGAAYALYRDKKSSDYSQMAPLFLRKCREYGIGRVLLHSDAGLAHTLGADGVHLTSTQFDEIAAASERGLYVIISTHSHDEALRAQELGADAITYSPIFFSPNKGEPKGLEDLKELLAKIDIPVFALGGITTAEQIQAVGECGAYGFASIRYFIH